MALTMTRTRTQTALTKLVELVANIHGELELVERLLTEWPAHRELLASRLRLLGANRDALYVTLLQFDPSLDPSAIGPSEEWLSAYGRSGDTRVKRHLAAMLRA